MQDIESVTAFAGGLLGVEVHEATRLSGGASRETWRLRTVDREIILQRQRVGDGRAVAREAAAVAAAAAAGAPVPGLIASGVDTEGRGYLMTEAIEGETIARRILRDDRFAVARTVLTGQLGAALAAVHAVDPGAVPDLDHAEPLERLRQIFDDMAEPHPAFELAFIWLAEHRPAPVPPSLVHGDFRLGNLVVGEDGLRAVLDWELVHLGDPMEDLGWLSIRAWRFGGREPVAGLGGYGELFEAYRLAGGAEVDPERVRWWRVFGTLQWGVMCMAQARAHLSGTVRSHELAAIGRRVCENEYDVLVEMGMAPAPPVSRLPAVNDLDSGRSTLHDAPGAAELLVAVREWLNGDVVPSVDGRLRFHAAVAANVLGIVEREIRAGSSIEERHMVRLAALGVVDDTDLAALIRRGAVGVEAAMGDVIAAVTDSVVDKLLVANPRHLS